MSSCDETDDDAMKSGANMATYKPSRSQHYLGWDWLYLLLEMLEVIGQAGLVRHPFFLLMLAYLFGGFFLCWRN